MTSYTEPINRAFSRQSNQYDADDAANPVLQDMRQQVYDHVDRFIRPASRILELNAGTGIDALRFVTHQHRVHATDVSDGMIVQIQQKIDRFHLYDSLSVQQVSYAELSRVKKEPFDYIFSNFGGLNCIDDLTRVTCHFEHLLKKGAHVTLVVMPPVCVWELLWLLKGHLKKAFRRFGKNGVKAHLEGEYFQTYYHSLNNVRAALGPSFTLIASEGLAALSPQPHRGDFPRRYPALYKFLRNVDRLLRNRFPFNRWADHLIVTFRYTPR